MIKFFSILSILLPNIAFALSYELSAPIPGAGVDTASDFQQYISFLFPFMLSFAALSALIMFVLGGIQYTIGGANPEQMKSGRERISNAIWGLLLAVFSVLILQTINPELLKLNLVSIETIDISSTVGGATTGGPKANNSQCNDNVECTSGFCGLPSGFSSGQKVCLRTGIPLGSECVHTEQCSTTFTSPLTCKSGFCQDH